MAGKKRLVALVLTAVVGVAGGALASHVAQVDPETVPAGFLVTHNRIGWVGVKALERAVKPDGADIFVQHIRLGPGEATPWHTHPGPVFVTMVAGSGTVEKVKDGACVRKAVAAGTGFFDRSQTHRVVAGDQGAHIYATFVLPAGAETHITPHNAPAECAAALNAT